MYWFTSYTDRSKVSVYIKTEHIIHTDALTYGSLKSSTEIYVWRNILYQIDFAQTHTHTAHGWLVAKGLCCVFKKKDNQERAWKAERHRENKKDREREREHDAQREKTDGIWVPHGESTRTPQRKTLHLPFLCLNHSTLSFSHSSYFLCLSGREPGSDAHMGPTHRRNTTEKTGKRW